MLLQNKCAIKSANPPIGNERYMYIRIIDNVYRVTLKLPRALSLNRHRPLRIPTASDYNAKNKIFGKLKKN